MSVFQILSETDSYDTPLKEDAQILATELHVIQKERPDKKRGKEQLMARQEENLVKRRVRLWRNRALLTVFAGILTACGQNGTALTGGVINRGTPMTLQQPLQLLIPYWYDKPLSDPSVIGALAFSADNRYLVNSGDPLQSEPLYVWSLSSGDLVQQANSIIGGDYLAFLGDSHRILSRAVSRGVQVWDVDQKRMVLDGIFGNAFKEGNITSKDFEDEMAVDFTGMLLSGSTQSVLDQSTDGQLGLWELQKGKLLNRFNIPKAKQVYPVCYKRDRKSFVYLSRPSATTTIDLNISTWDIESQNKIDDWTITFTNKRYKPVISADCTRLVVLGMDGISGVWDTTTHAKIQDFALNLVPPWVGAITPNNKYFIVGADTLLAVFDMSTGRKVVQLSPYYERPNSPTTGNKGLVNIEALAVSPDGQYVAVGGQRTVLIFPLGELGT